MASSKKLVLTNDSKKNEVLLKDRVKELEEEIVGLKKRLEDLRKAKNTTVLKREREILEVGTPFGKRDSKPTITAPPPPPVAASKVPAEFQKKLDDLKAQLAAAEKNHDTQIKEAEAKLSNVQGTSSKEMDDLRKQFAKDMEAVKKAMEQELECGHQPIIEALQHQLLELQADNTALLMENSDLKDRVNSLVTELSIKEASWCEAEEKLKIELNKQWGEKYKEWMEKTENKIRELQEANTMLRTYFNSQKPKGPDPTGQDK
ncbi:desmoplakin-B-like isoform X1 [Saccostrea echinata]|uniref:desmoplakin-B-like isoform X1 n=1 Tax=Saccostrea echinata TaxID=191078 RepID=UPI002A824EDA|nr:desmoplakin-B-like isoform X1 [Saccostrea echinata]